MNLNNISLFIRLVETGSFTAAAESLGVQKSTISRRIDQLEDELGVRLLQRTPRKLSLTDAGQALYQQSQPLLEALNGATESLTENSSNPSGRLRMTMPAELGVYMIDEIIADFSRRYPRIQLEIEMSTRVVNLIEEGFDLAIRVGSLDDSSLVAKRLACINRGLYASPEYLARCGTPENPDQLTGHNYLSIINHVQELSFESWPEAVKVSGSIKVNSLLFQRCLLLKGLGIARMPRAFCQPYVERGELVEVLVDHPPPTLDINLVYPSKRHLNAKVRLFIDHLEQHLGPNPWLQS